LRTTGREPEAVRLPAARAPSWPEDTPAGPAGRNMVLWLVDTLISAGEMRKARRLLNRAMPDRSGNADALAFDGRLSLDEGDPEEAARIGYALHRLGARQAADAMVHHIGRKWPVLINPPHPWQRATILVCDPVRHGPDALANVLRGVHCSLNYPSEFALAMQNEFRFVSVLVDLPENAYPARLPEADVILNNTVNAERLNEPGRLELVRSRIDRTGLPVINHPDQAVQTTRVNNARVLAGIPNLKVPRIEHYDAERTPIAEIVTNIGGRFSYPLIVRIPSAQMSSGSLLSEENKFALLVPDAASLTAHLERSRWPEFYAIEYADLRREDGFYRKMRAVMVDREVFLIQVAMYSDWMVSGWRHRPEGISFYRENPHTIEECNRIVLDPEAQLGSTVMRTLEAVRDRIPLDIFGIDFDVDREGRVVFFEAGEMMSFSFYHERQPEDVRLPEEPLLATRKAFSDLVTRRIAERKDRPA